tara:strand:- start:984 stop:1412 length:429 start_codon:yes stop_codon:yes gene_type:complete
MANKISSDISTNIDITARKGDSFYLEAQVNNTDGTSFDLTEYTDMTMLVITNTGKSVLTLNSGTVSSGNANFTKIIKPGSVTSSAPTTGKILISLDFLTVDTVNGETYHNTDIPVGTYKYTLHISNSINKHTILNGKFKIVI